MTGRPHLLVRLRPRRRPRGSIARVAGKPRILLPFATGSIDPEVLAAAIRITRAEEGVLVPAFLLVVPREFSLDAPLTQQVAMAMPLLEGIEHAALRSGIPVDARVERGRQPTHALRTLWETEDFERIIVPAPTPGDPGFTPKELAWVLTHAPAEALILRPAPDRARKAGKRLVAALARG